MPPTQPDPPFPSLVDRVAMAVRSRILDGEYAPGSRLRLQELAEDAGTSLIPVREALRVLESERLVETIPNRGARVSPLSLDDMQDLYRVRVLLEVECVRQARSLGEEDVSALTVLLDGMKDAVNAGDVDGMMSLHRRYHFALYQLSESTWLTFLIELLWLHAERYQRTALIKRTDDVDHEHRSILDALVQGDSETASERLRTHLITTSELVTRAYEEPQST